MRELNNNEIASVAGAGLFSDIGKGVGFLVGSVIDQGASAGGLTTSCVDAVTQLGGGIGKILELNISGAINDIGAGVVGLLKYAIDSVNSLSLSANA
ncbi:hypothetical protein [Erwinia sp. 198]|uniref:hypothetical protein n=1 Tax=Erwinia sp. 198 TaxID=2022746 RepID=UPI000F66FD90|nr:hypothetical protein [Erwinia sp. 198]RRZ88481.1 hypothetical protein EGK14_17385 [Erwinia sp. 198]